MLFVRRGERLLSLKTAVGSLEKPQSDHPYPLRVVETKLRLDFGLRRAAPALHRMKAIKKLESVTLVPSNLCYCIASSSKGGQLAPYGAFQLHSVFDLIAR